MIDRKIFDLYDLLSALGVDAWQVQLAMPLGRMERHKERWLIAPKDLVRLEKQLAELIARNRLAIAVCDNIGYYGRHEPLLRGAFLERKGQDAEVSFWRGCMAGCRVVAISPDGGIKGCPSHPEELIADNIRKTPFARIWRTESNFEYNTRWDESLLQNGCARCPFRRVCRAGCTSMAFATTGTVYDNPFCLQRVRIEADNA